MSEKKFDVGALVNNGVGHPLARAMAKGLWNTQLLRRFASQNPGTMMLISKGLMALTSLIEVGGDHPIARFANYVSETLATENLDLLKKFEENPDDPELAKKIGAAIETAEKDVVIAFDHIHKDAKCLPVAQLITSTTTTRTGKEGKTFTIPSPIQLVMTDMSSALAAHKPLCGLCYPAPVVAKSDNSSKESAPGRNFMEYVMRLEQEEPDTHRIFWGLYLNRLQGNDGPELARKFGEAFTGKHSYEAFRFVARLPDMNALGQQEWHHAIDALLGKVTPKETLREQIEGFVDKEAAETAEMLRVLDKWMRRANKSRAIEIRERKESIQRKRKAFDVVAARERRKSRTLSQYMLVSLAIFIAACVIMANCNKQSSPKKEQKVEKVDVR